MSFTPPRPGCRRCPRLVDLRRTCRTTYPNWHNAPVESLGSLDSRRLIIGLAPGLRGANRTGRPFTGDAAGGYLFHMLARFGLATGTYSADADDDISLHDVRITNAVRCLPPENKPTPAELANCRYFLAREIAAMAYLDTILVLGRQAHDAALRCLDQRPSSVPFHHGGVHMAEYGKRRLRLVSSYHCSRYNTQTGRLTDAMFEEAISLFATPPRK
ncbi:MAG: uracil-DNA glycosylase [Rhodospirillaceae bacterium]|nr:uracil-DNA glycosylase [Rhodospirillaceae bacterium]